MSQIKVNGKVQTVDSETITVSELITLNKVQNPQTVSVQLNEEFVSSKNYSTTVVKDGDVIDFLYFMGGGQF